MTTTYETKHIGFASFLRYVLGNESHLSTERKGNGYSFSFHDPEYKCRDLQTAFFSEEGAAVGNAQALLDCSREISHSISYARQYEIWEKPE